jgi:hypothetical protein
MSDSGKTFKFSKVITNEKKKIYEQTPNSIDYFRFVRCGRSWKLFISICRYQNATHVKKEVNNKSQKELEGF